MALRQLLRRTAAPLTLALLASLAACGDDPATGGTPPIGGGDAGSGSDVGVSTDTGEPGDGAVGPGDVGAGDSATGDTAGGPDGTAGGPDGTADAGQDTALGDAPIGDAGPEDAAGDVELPDGGPGDVSLPDGDGQTIEDVEPGPDGADDAGADGGADTGSDTGTDGGPIPGDEDHDCENPPLVAVPAGETCAATSGSATVLLQGRVLAPGKVLHSGQLLIQDGTIQCVGCDCASWPEAQGATKVDCAGGVISPGLINAHDHITFTQAPPAGHGTERYEHRHDWRKGKNGHTKLTVKQNSYNKGESWGELRMLLSGTTSINSSGGEDGLIRNLDKPYLLEGLAGKTGATYDTFPLGDSGGTQAASGCGSYKIDPASSLADDQAYTPHVGEGINDFAHNEFVCLSGTSGGAQDYLLSNTAFIHAIGVTAVDIALMAGRSTKLIWSPRSNIDLYGHTASVTIYRELGVVIALGTDWSASGSMNTLRELACADALNSDLYDGAFSDRELVEMATINGATVLGFDDVLGSLAPGKVADIAVFRAAPGATWRGVLDAQVQDVALVLRGGLVQLGDDAVVGKLPNGGPSDCEPIDVCGVDKRVCTPREIGMKHSELKSAVMASDSQTYPLFFCKTPDNEPSCVPYRKGEFDGLPKAGDMDGDGIGDAKDNCPGVFNPPRPMDKGEQPNIDGDGDGDACDPCPFDADSTACTSVDPTDVDGDGISNNADNCKNAANPKQEDADGDFKGDACDPCPAYPNPGVSGCPTSIYDIKSGIAVSGDNVIVQDAVVTAVGSAGFFLQMRQDLPSWKGPEYSGIYVYTKGSIPVERGDHLDIQGTVAEFYGQLELVDGTVKMLPGKVALPDPAVIADPSVLTTTSETAEAWEGVLVRVETVTVTDIAPDPGAEKQPINEFVVTGGLRVDDFFYLITPFPTAGATFEGLTGVMRWSYDNMKLEPRDALDVQKGPPSLVALDPPLVAIEEGTTGMTTPQLVVKLSGPVKVPTDVTLTSSKPSVVAPLGGVVTLVPPQSSAVVELQALAASDEPVTLTASLAGAQVTSKVVVYAPGASPVPVLLLPEEATAVVGQVASFTVQLSFPAPDGGVEVTLAADPPGAATLPASVTVPAGELAASFDVTAGPAAALVGVTASAGGAEVMALLDIVETPPLGLILLEVYYDHPSDDVGYEWVKLYNGTGAPVDLSGWSIGTGGTGWTYQTLQLQGTVPPGACFIVGGPSSVADNGAPTYSQAASFGGNIQNGGTAADGLALFSMKASQIQASSKPVDAVLWGTPGSNSSGLVGPDGSPAPVHVKDVGPGASIVRTGASTWDASDTPNASPCAPPAP